MVSQIWEKWKILHFWDFIFTPTQIVKGFFSKFWKLTLLFPYLERKKENEKFRDEKKEATVTQKSEKHKEDKENKVQETPQKSDEDWEKIKKEKEERRKQKEKERLERLEKKPKYKVR